MSLEKLRSELNLLLLEYYSDTNLWQEAQESNPDYPFNEYEYVISHLIGVEKLSLSQYKQLRVDYLHRVPNIFWYTVAGKTFGSEMEKRVLGLHSDFQKPDKAIDPEAYRYYDLVVLHNDTQIKVEVKASRCMDANNSSYNQVKRALSVETQAAFDMNFQQIKPRFCDVFVFVILWLDDIRYVVLSSDEVRHSKYYSDKQHKGNIGEGQLHITDSNIHEFGQYEVKPENLKPAIIAKFLQK